MSKREVRLILLDVVEAIAKVERYTAGLDFQSFATDELRVDAVIRNLEVIGEAARQIPNSLRLRYRGTQGSGIPVLISDSERVDFLPRANSVSPRLSVMMAW